MRVDSLAEQLFFCTVRIETTCAGKKGSGTGFLYSVEPEPGAPIPFMVTNKHVVDRAELGSFWFHEGTEENQRSGATIPVLVQDFEQKFFPHPDPDCDIAVMPIGNILNELDYQHGKMVFSRILPQQMRPSEEQLYDLDAIEGVIFIGYPNGIYDSVNHLPIARKGHTATPVQVDYEGKSKFLIDAAVFPGSSGSPVFILNSGGYAHRGGFNVASRIFLIGVISAVYTLDEIGSIVSRPVPTTDNLLVLRQMINLGIVEKSRTIDEAIWAYLATQGISTPSSTVAPVS